MGLGGELGRTYRDGEILCRQGDVGDCLFVVQEGEFEVVRDEGGRSAVIRVAGKDEILGEMAIFDRAPRSATVRARGPGRVLTLDKRNFLRRINEDPSLAFRIVETMSRRVRELTDQVASLRAELAGKGGGGPR
jgi:CRP-like cAMP-binding protein